MAGSCAVSGLAVNPWWAVDLGVLMHVKFVVVTMRKQCVIVLSVANALLYLGCVFFAWRNFTSGVDRICCEEGQSC